jgi:hypothetical protein
LKSKKAFDNVKYLGSEKAETKVYYLKRAKRDNVARETYFNNYRQNIVANGLFILDIIRKEIKNGDKIL